MEWTEMNDRDLPQEPAATEVAPAVPAASVRGSAQATAGDLAIDFRSMSTRLAHVLIRNRITTIRDLLALSPGQAMELRGFGKKCRADMQSYLREYQIQKESSAVRYQSFEQIKEGRHLQKSSDTVLNLRQSAKPVLRGVEGSVLLSVEMLFF
jgi:DNA-directed RNA polymerase alpha subunit